MLKFLKNFRLNKISCFATYRDKFMLPYRYNLLGKNQDVFFSIFCLDPKEPMAYCSMAEWQILPPSLEMAFPRVMWSKVMRSLYNTIKQGHYGIYMHLD